MYIYKIPLNHFPYRSSFHRYIYTEVHHVPKSISSIYKFKTLERTEICYSILIMGDADRSSSHDVSPDSTEQTNQASKIKFSEEEEILIAMVYNLVGERWSLIAGRIPGRTAEEIEKYWTSRYSSTSE
ncbi:transcription factor TRY-like [Arachis stenosperma]|nr:transcription factor TRY-like [Arachis stenosperma]